MTATDQRPATGPGADPPEGVAAQRGRLRAEVASAARLVAPLWPVDRFIAVNPMHGLTGVGFDDARAVARRWLGASTLPDVAVARRAVAEGRLTVEDLTTALVDRAPDLGPDGDLAARTPGTTPVELALADLLAGTGPDPVVPGPRTALERLDAHDGTAVAAAVDAEVARWCALAVDAHPTGDGGAVSTLWSTWRRLAPHDRALRRLIGRHGRDRLADLPERPDDAIAVALGVLGVAAHRRVDELRGQLARLPGWAGYARWCDDWATADDPAPRLSVIDLLAVRLTVDALALAHRGTPAPDPGVDGALEPGGPSAARIEAALAAVGADPGDRGLRVGAADVLATCTTEVVGGAVLDALEARLADDLLGRLAAGAAPGPTAPAAQVVCCIDVRSEGLRRHLEAVGPYDTIGFAGFFATAIRYRALGSAEAVPLAPALVVPEIEVPEVPDDAMAPAAVAGRRRRDARLGGASADTGHGPLSMYAMAEATGWVLGPRALATTLWPALAARSGTDVAGRVDVHGDETADGFSLEGRTLVAESALRTMGLTEGFAPIVVLCGHGASTTANAHASSLDCGACGGSRGGPNARAAAAILNDADVRAGLADLGIDVPASTWFVAAEHDTTTDEVHLLETALVPAELRPALDRLADDLAAAGRANAAERVEGLPGRSAPAGGSGSRAVRARSGDWAQTRPEWGLAGNAAIVVGSRDLTRGTSLDGRAFLHSYDAAADTDGAVLETILTAPVVVAHWINMGYYGATVDPRRWGAGDKTLHNPIPGVGVLEGLGGDLRPGLPWQSVADERGARHEPVRLLTEVAAPTERIEDVIARNRVLRELFDGEWVHLVARDPADGPDGGWRRRRPGGGWHDVDGPPGPRTEETS